MFYEIVSCFFDNGSCGMKNFIPRVPNSTGEGEDKNTARICLAPSVEKCVQAVGQRIGGGVLEKDLQFMK